MLQARRAACLHAAFRRAASGALPGLLPAGRAMVSRLLNCEDILLNFVAAAAIQEQQQQQQGGSGSQQAAALPHAVWAQPGRRLDISILSKVGISRAGASHTSERGCCYRRLAAAHGPAPRWACAGAALTLGLPLLQTRGPAVLPSSASGTGGILCRSSKLSGTGAARPGGSSPALSAACLAWAACTCSLLSTA